MKKNILKVACLCISLCLTACEDFFNVTTDSMLDGNEYMKESNEMYTGYIGLFSRLQAVADKAIYLTDTRGDILTLTDKTPRELLNIYQYADDLTDNSYADPGGYYDVIIGCNDYLNKIREFKDENIEIIDMNHYRALVSGTIRIKTWAYFMLGKIYGQAVWFDDPLVNVSDLSVYPLLSLDQLIDKCIAYLDTGIDGVNGKLDMFSWEEWLKADQDDSSSTDEEVNNYQYWDLVTPPYFVLAADLHLWKGDNYWLVVDLIRTALNNSFLTKGDRIWNMGFFYNRYYAGIFDANIPYMDYSVFVLPYFSKKGQTNGLKRHFDIYDPNEGLLGVSTPEVMSRYWEQKNNPMSDEQRKKNGGDTRFRTFFNANGESTSQRDSLRLTKYFQPNSKTLVYRWDNPVSIYRSTELYLMLIEAYIHLGQFGRAKTLMNKGIATDYPEGKSDFTNWIAEGYTAAAWRAASGFRSTYGLDDRTFEESMSEEALKKNDLQILDEYLLEFAAEGKNYATMIRMARRYNDYRIIADRVCPKYKADGLDEQVRTKLERGEWFIPWNLRISK